jgi:1-acyl-sn-glycerol-3-phosphate acyltransferase
MKPVIQEELTKSGAESQTVEARRERNFRNVLLIFVINLIGFWFILPGTLLFFGSLLDDIFSVPPPTGLTVIRVAAGGILLLAGFLVSLYSILLFAYYGDGMPIASLPPKRLVEQGPYNLSRHPIYLGYSISLIGLGIAFWSLFFLLLILPMFVLCWILYVLLYEERVLMKRYGTPYQTYREKTPLLFSYKILRNAAARMPAKNQTPPLLFMLSSVVFKVYGGLFFDLEVSGDPNPDTNQPFILVANHANYLDPFLINSCIRRFVRTMTTEKPFRHPVCRLYLESAGAFSFARYKPFEVHAIRETLRLLSAGASIGIFPEGERTWDGRPLGISDAAIRFLKKTGRPIIAINVSGNYNALPRWSRRPRRSKIKIHFHEPFLFPEDNSLEEDRKMLEKRLVLPGASYDDSILLKEKNLAEGLPLLLWRCPLCKRNDSLLVEQGLCLLCSGCGSSWKLQPNYHLKLLRNGSGRENFSASTLSDWYALVEEDICPLSPLPLTYAFLREGEKVFLQSAALHYSSYHGLKRTLSKRGHLILTGRRLIFFNRRTVIGEDLNLIKKMVIEGNDQLELGFTGRMTSVRFCHESPLKWQAYIRRIREGDCRPT